MHRADDLALALAALSTALDLADLPEGTERTRKIVRLRQIHAKLARLSRVGG